MSEAQLAWSGLPHEHTYQSPEYSVPILTTSRCRHAIEQHALLPQDLVLTHENIHLRSEWQRGMSAWPDTSNGPLKTVILTTSPSLTPRLPAWGRPTQ